MFVIRCVFYLIMYNNPINTSNTISDKQKAHQSKQQLCDNKYFDLPTDLEIVSSNWLFLILMPEHDSKFHRILKFGWKANKGAWNYEYSSKICFSQWSEP